MRKVWRCAVALVVLCIGVASLSSAQADGGDEPNFSIYNASAVAQGIGYRIDWENNSLSAALRGAGGFSSMGITDRGSQGEAAFVSPGFAVTDYRDIATLVGGDYLPGPLSAGYGAVKPYLPGYPFRVVATGDQPVSAAAADVDAPDDSYAARAAAQGCTAMAAGAMTCATHAYQSWVGSKGSATTPSKLANTVTTANPNVLTDPNAMLAGPKSLLGTVSSPAPGVPNPGEVIGQAPPLPTASPAAPLIAAVQQALAAGLAGLPGADRAGTEDARLVEVGTMSAVTGASAAGSALVSTAETALSDVDILGGLIHFDALRAESRTDSDGKTSKQQGRVKVVGASIGGIPVEITDEGVRVGPGAPILAGSSIRELNTTLNQALANAGISLDVHALANGVRQAAQGEVNGVDALRVLIHPTLPVTQFPGLAAFEKPVIELFLGTVETSGVGSLLESAVGAADNAAGSLDVGALPGDAFGPGSGLSEPLSPTSLTAAPSTSSSGQASQPRPTVLASVLSGVDRSLVIGLFGLWQAVGMATLVAMARRRLGSAS